jgi:hypothetical protein
MIASRNLTVFNSTSFALRSLYFILKRKQIPKVVPMKQDGLVKIYEMMKFFYNRDVVRASLDKAFINRFDI